MCFTNRSNLQSNRSLHINPVKDSKIVFFMYNISIEADECFLCQVVVGEEHQCEPLTKWISKTLKQFCWSAHLPLIFFVRKSSHCNSAFWRDYTAQLSLNGSCDVTMITWVFFITQISTFKRLFDLKLKSKVETRWTFYFRVLFSAHMNCCCWIKCFFLKIDNTNKTKYPISFRNI